MSKVVREGDFEKMEHAEPVEGGKQIFIGCWRRD